MSKIPKISGNQMIMHLQRKGLIITHRKGSHVTMMYDHIFTTVPAGNATLKAGTFHSVLSDVRIGRDEFIKDYHNKLVK